VPGVLKVMKTVNSMFSTLNIAFNDISPDS
jgi:hypothetical protein